MYRDFLLLFFDVLLAFFEDSLFCGDGVGTLCLCCCSKLSESRTSYNNNSCSSFWVSCAWASPVAAAAATCVGAGIPNMELVTVADAPDEDVGVAADDPRFPWCGIVSTLRADATLDLESINPISGC